MTRRMLTAESQAATKTDLASMTRIVEITAGLLAVGGIGGAIMLMLAVFFGG